MSSEDQFAINVELISNFFHTLTSTDSSENHFNVHSEIQEKSGEFGAILTNLYDTIKNKSDLKTLKTETNLWQLLQILSSYEIQSLDLREWANTQHPIDPTAEPPNFGFQYQEAIDQLAKTDTDYSKAKAILLWLENMFNQENNDNKFNEPGALAAIRHDRENLLDDLQRNKVKVGLHQVDLMNDGMNPDFVNSKNGFWYSEIDKNDSLAMSKLLWNLLKAGNHQDIMKILQDNNQFWRYQACFKPYISDANYHGQHEHFLTESQKAAYITIDNMMNRDVNSTCSDMTEYDRAIHAVNITGNVKVALKVCTTWQEKLWVYLKIFVDRKEQSYVNSYCTSMDIFGFDLEDDQEFELKLPETVNYAGDDGIDEDDESLSDNNKQINEVIPTNLPSEYWDTDIGNDLNKVIEKAITLDSSIFGLVTRGILISQPELLVENLDNLENPRFSATLGVLTRFDDISEKYLPIYCNELLKTVKFYCKRNAEMVSEFVKQKLPIICDLLPFYISKINDPEIQATIFGDLIATTTRMSDNENSISILESLRSDVLASGEKYDIDVLKSSINIIDVTRKDQSKTDQEKIQVLDLLLFNNSPYDVLLRQVNNLCRYFILAETVENEMDSNNNNNNESKNEYLKKALTKLPKQITSVIDNQDQTEIDLNEHQSFILYSRAIDQFDEYISMKSRINSDLKLNEVKPYAKKFVRTVRELINYPNGGFMTSVLVSDINLELLEKVDVRFKKNMISRNNELKAIRNLVIPRFISLIFDTMAYCELDEQLMETAVELVRIRGELVDCLDSGHWSMVMGHVQKAGLNRLRSQ